MISRYSSNKELQEATLEEVEDVLEKSLEEARKMDWNLGTSFEKDLMILTNLAKSKGSQRKW